MTCLGHVPEGSILRETLNKRGGLGPCLGVVWSNPGSEGVRSKVPSATLAWIPSLGPEVTKSGQKGGYSGRGPNMTQNDPFCLMSLLGLTLWRGPKTGQNRPILGHFGPFCLMSLLGLDPNRVKYDPK